MIQSVAQVTVPVGDYDEALSWYTKKLGLVVRTNVEMGPGYRWVSVGPKGEGVELLLHLRGDLRDHHAREGVAPLLVFYTDDCRRDHERLAGTGVRFLASPVDLPWGVQAMFEDPYGNRYVIVERRLPVA